MGGGSSLFELAVKRNQKICENILIVLNSEHYFLATESLEKLGVKTAKFILEPLPKNTAAAVALACLTLPSDEIVLVTPSDHIIKDEINYQKAVENAVNLAKFENLVVFGITPDSPQTGFGYIKADGQSVKAFHEKPSFETAKKYLEKGGFYWNSGMFVFKAGVFLGELKKHSPDILKSCETALKNAQKDGHILRINCPDMKKIPENSVDYAVMEKSKILKIVPAQIGWNDAGSFDALYDELPKDANGNTKSQNLVAIDSKNNLIYASDRKIATIGIEDCLIIDSGDALLIAKKGSSQKVKNVVEILKNSGSDLPNIHLTASRPWGSYTVLENADGYKIKKLVVKPGKRLSLQKHFHRSEHWIVVSGTASVSVENETKIIRPNESTYIKAGQIHRLGNPGKIPLVLVEVQVGEYTGEDDIVRIEDDFKR